MCESIKVTGISLLIISVIILLRTSVPSYQNVPNWSLCSAGGEIFFVATHQVALRGSISGGGGGKGRGAGGERGACSLPRGFHCAKTSRSKSEENRPRAWQRVNTHHIVGKCCVLLTPHADAW